MYTTEYQAHNIDEDIPIGSSILRVKASDADSGSNADIAYHVSDDSFAVDSDGLITNNRRLDAHSNNAYYEFQVTAKDQGEPSRTGAATVRIFTENKNDQELRKSTPQTKKRRWDRRPKYPDFVKKWKRMYLYPFHQFKKKLFLRKESSATFTFFFYFE